MMLAGAWAVETAGIEFASVGPLPLPKLSYYNDAASGATCFECYVSAYSYTETQQQSGHFLGQQIGGATWTKWVDANRETGSPLRRNLC